MLRFGVLRISGEDAPVSDFCIVKSARRVQGEG
jgi:hypothetical protein